MKDENMTKQQIISELNELRKRLIELENVHKGETAPAQASRKLFISEEMYSKAFYNNPDPITISTEAEGRYVEVNTAYSEMTGYDRFESIGKTAYDLGIWADPEDRNHMLKRLREQGKVSALETRFKNKMGEIFTFLLSIEVITLAGEPHLLHLCKDITELKDIEEALRLSEESFSKAFNASPIPMSISTLEEGRLLYVNDSFCRVMGNSREILTGLTSIEAGILVDSDQREEFKNILKENGSISEREVQFRKISGEIRQGSFSAELLDIDDEICALCLFADQTERKQMEVEIERLKRLNLVGEMAASIAHEIRNPMTTVRGYLQILRHNKDYIKEIEYFDLMIEELDTANAIITEFIALAKNKMVELKAMNLNAILKNIHPLLQANAMIQDKVVILDTQELPDLLLDEKEICQLVYNLVKNGLEAIPPGRSVKVKTYVADDTVVLAIEDEGHGIDPKILPELGTPFITTKAQGTGLGLPVCYGIATRHNAKINIETNSNGTTVFVCFSYLDDIPG